MIRVVSFGGAFLDDGRHSDVHELELYQGNGSDMPSSNVGVLAEAISTRTEFF